MSMRVAYIALNRSTIEQETELLDALGMAYIPCIGYWNGVPERSYRVVIVGCGMDKLRALAERCQQEAILIVRHDREGSTAQLVFRDDDYKFGEASQPLEWVRVGRTEAVKQMAFTCFVIDPEKREHAARLVSRPDELAEFLRGCRCEYWIGQ